MRSFFRSLLAFAAGAYLLAATAPAQAQTFPNSTLDNWATRNTAVSTGVDAPTNWLTTDDLARVILKQPLPITTGTVTKAPAARTGAFAAQLQTQDFMGEALPGYLILGTSISGGVALPGGIPFTSRPSGLQFYYQLSGARAIADSAGVLVQLTRRVNGSPVVIAEGFYFIPALAATYTVANVPLQYRSTQAPDSVSMLFASGLAETITSGTIMRVDDITFTGGTTTATRDAALDAAVTVFPNPSPDGRYVLSATEPALLTAPITILDATGRVVRREAAPKGAVATRALDLNNLAQGMYTMQLLTNRGLITKKLTVQ